LQSHDNFKNISTHYLDVCSRYLNSMYTVSTDRTSVVRSHTVYTE